MKVRTGIAWVVFVMIRMRGGPDRYGSPGLRRFGKRHMAKQETTIRIWFWFVLPVVLLGGCLVLDARLLSAARPPEGMRTIEDFRVWQGKVNKGGERIYENSGQTYIVMTGPAGRSLASGPSAYLFDTNGQFIDWTSDMGDHRTKKFGFDLTGGVVKRVGRTNEAMVGEAKGVE